MAFDFTPTWMTHTGISGGPYPTTRSQFDLYYTGLGWTEVAPPGGSTRNPTQFYQSTAPGNPVTDDIWFDTTTHVVRHYNGTAFVPMDSWAPIAKSATYVSSTYNELVLATAGSAFTVTAPTPVGKAGAQFGVKKVDASGNAVTVATAAGLIDGAATLSLATQNTVCELVSDGANWFKL